jgi:hypothetical protein
MFIGTLYETKIQAKTQRSLGRSVPASISARPTTQAFLKAAFELGIAGGPTHGLIDAITRRTMRGNLKKAILKRIPGYAPVFNPRYLHLPLRLQAGIWNVGRRNEKGASRTQSADFSSRPSNSRKMTGIHQEARIDQRCGRDARSRVFLRRDFVISAAKRRVKVQQQDALGIRPAKNELRDAVGKGVRLSGTRACDDQGLD